MQSNNIVVLVGRLTQDPVTRTAGDQLVANFSIAIRSTYKKDAVDFFNCTAWANTAEFMQKYSHKGDKVVVVGALKNDNYTASDGSKRSRTYVNVNSIELAGSSGGKNKQLNPQPDLEDDDDDFPF